MLQKWLKINTFCYWVEPIFAHALNFVYFHPREIGHNVWYFVSQQQNQFLSTGISNKLFWLKLTGTSNSVLWFSLCGNVRREQAFADQMSFPDLFPPSYPISTDFHSVYLEMDYCCHSRGEGCAWWPSGFEWTTTGHSVYFGQQELSQI